MPITRKPQGSQGSAQYDVITRVNVLGGAQVVVKITTEAIEGRGRAACIGMAAAKIRALAGKLPKEIIVSTSDFR